MKAALLIESKTGNTWKAGERIATNLMQEGWEIAGVDPVTRPNHGAIQAADIVLVGTWVDGLFLFGQKPFAEALISQLPAMHGKRAAVFCTFGLNPGKTLAKLSGVVSGLGADVVGGLALHRGKLDAHAEAFAARLLDTMQPA
jgi:flavodoxin